MINFYLYPVRHWLTSLAVGPLLVFISNIVINSADINANDFFANYILLFFFGLIFSLPTIVFYYVVYNLLIKRQTSPVIIKIILDIVAVLGMCLTLHLIGGTAIPGMYAPYSTAIVVCSLFYKTEKPFNII